jgi:hypothetical protein
MAFSARDFAAADDDEEPATRRFVVNDSSVEALREVLCRPKASGAERPTKFKLDQAQRSRAAETARFTIAPYASEVVA